MRPPSLSASTLRGIYHKIMMLYDVEVRFDCAGSHTMRPPSLSASTLRGIDRNIVMLSDVEVRFDRLAHNEAPEFVREHCAGHLPQNRDVV